MPTCIVCGQPFEASKKNAKTCGDVCRKRLSRRRGEIGRLGAAAVYNLRMLNKYGHDWPDLERQCRGQLERIKLEVSALVPYQVLPRDVTAARVTAPCAPLPTVEKA